MKKVYLVAVKWDKTHDEDGYNYVIPKDAHEGDDIAGFTEHYAYKDGWRIYVNTTKKARDDFIRYVLNKGEKQWQTKNNNK